MAFFPKICSVCDALQQTEQNKILVTILMKKSMCSVSQQEAVGEVKYETR